jgi:hypothetical protein
LKIFFLLAVFIVLPAIVGSWFYGGGGREKVRRWRGGSKGKGKGDYEKVQQRA